MENRKLGNTAIDRIPADRWENEGGKTDKKEKKMSCCSDVMKPIEESSCCTLKDSAAHAAKAIRASGCGCAPVLEDTKTRKLIGFVTERDLCCSVTADDRKASDVGVAEIMKPISACCQSDEPVANARRKLHEHRATSLPVVDSAGSCCGTVSAHHL